MRLFGTNGVRGKIGADFTPPFLVKLGMAIGSYLPKKSKVAVGSDTRISGDLVKNAVISGLLSTGVDVIDISVAPTPAIQYYTKNHADFGIAITASHNPPEFNGVKCIDSDGTELSRDKECAIESIFFSEKFRTVPWNDVGTVNYDDALEEYVNAIISKVDANLIKSKKYTVALDCANGAACYTTPYLLSKLGVRVISLNCQPDGTFPGHESEPKPENLRDLMALVRDCDADLGIAHDGDADRAIFIDENGRFLYGDKTLALVAREIVKERKGIVVTPVSSSLAVEEVVKAQGGKVIYTPVGAPIVARKMIEINAVFGGEENGGLIFPEHQYCRDGGMSVAKILEIMAKTGKTLSELIDSLPVYYQTKISVPCDNSIKEIVLENIRRALENENISTMDGVKVMGEDWWVLIRPSGTEPIYRIYAEAKNEDTLREKVEKYKKILEKIIQQLS